MDTPDKSNTLNREIAHVYEDNLISIHPWNRNKKQQVSEHIKYEGNASMGLQRAKQRL